MTWAFYMHAYRDYTQLHTTRGKKRRKIKPHQLEVHGSCTFIAQAYSSVCVYVCVSLSFSLLFGKHFLFFEPIFILDSKAAMSKGYTNNTECNINMNEIRQAPCAYSPSLALCLSHSEHWGARPKKVRAFPEATCAARKQCQRNWKRESERKRVRERANNERTFTSLLCFTFVVYFPSLCGTVRERAQCMCDLSRYTHPSIFLYIEHNYKYNRLHAISDKRKKIHPKKYHNSCTRQSICAHAGNSWCDRAIKYRIHEGIFHGNCFSGKPVN